MNILIGLLTGTRRALRAWTTVWQHTPESSVDPSSDSGRIPSTSSALLSLAYVRLHLNTGPYRSLASRDPQSIADALHRCPSINRGDDIVSALLYATHALSIPVRLGIDRVARVQASFWTLRHTIAAFEAAVILSKWLSAISETRKVTPLSGKSHSLFDQRCGRGFDLPAVNIRVNADRSTQMRRLGSCTGSDV
jgi:hypothetical protein